MSDSASLFFIKWGLLRWLATFHKRMSKVRKKINYNNTNKSTDVCDCITKLHTPSQNAQFQNITQKTVELCGDIASHLTVNTLCSYVFPYAIFVMRF